MNETQSILDNNVDNDQKNIMVVDTAPLMQSILGSIIVGGGYKFTRTKSEKNALRLVEAYKPDLLIVRADTPDMDGYDLAEKLNSSGNTAPIIFMSDNVTKEGVIKAHRMGVKDYITNPVDGKVVLSKIAKQLA